MSEPRKLILDHRCAVGDSLVASAAIKALHESQHGAFLVDFIGHNGRLAPTGNNLFANNPYITPLFKGDPNNDPINNCPPGCQYVMMDYGYAVNNAGRPFHFLYGFVEHLTRKLGVHIELKDFRGDIWLSPEEMQVWPGLENKRYAIIDSGRKNDFTAKLWSVHRFQQVVNATKDKITWVQMGSAADFHPPLENVVNLVGQTNLRQLCQVMYRASLVLCPVTCFMHLASAVPTVDGSIRPSVVLMGQREQSHWEQYPGHTMLGTTGKLKCGVGIGCACWASKTIKVPGENASVCRLAIRDEVGEYVPECLHRISVEEVVAAIESLL